MNRVVFFFTLLGSSKYFSSLMTIDIWAVTACPFLIVTPPSWRSSAALRIILIEIMLASLWTSWISSSSSKSWFKTWLHWSLRWNKASWVCHSGIDLEFHQSLHAIPCELYRLPNNSWQWFRNITTPYIGMIEQIDHGPSEGCTCRLLAGYIKVKHIKD